MHSFIKTYTKDQTVSVPVDSVNAEITFITEDKINKNIIVKINCKDLEGDIVGNEEFVIFGENYNLLMSESPEFALGKPVNEYREIDLWYIIDLMVESSNTTEEEVAE